MYPEKERVACSLGETIEPY